MSPETALKALAFPCDGRRRGGMGSFGRHVSMAQGRSFSDAAVRDAQALVDTT